MFNKILVAIDPSDASKYAFDTAIFLAQKADAKLILLHIIPPPPEDPSVVTAYEEPWQQVEKKGWEILRSLTQEATTAGINAHCTQDWGNPGRAICNFAQTQSKRCFSAA